jgi:hypothetical protein
LESRQVNVDVQKMTRTRNLFGLLRDRVFHLCSTREEDSPEIPQELTNLVWKMFALRNAMDIEMNFLSTACAQEEVKMAKEATTANAVLRKAWMNLKTKSGGSTKAFYDALLKSRSLGLSLWNAMASRHLYAEQTMNYLKCKSAAADVMFPEYANPRAMLADKAEMVGMTVDIYGREITQKTITATANLCRPMAAALQKYFMEAMPEDLSGSPTDLVTFDENNKWSKEAKIMIKTGKEGKTLEYIFEAQKESVKNSVRDLWKVSDDSFAHRSTTLSEIRLEALNLHMRCAQRLLNLV